MIITIKKSNRKNKKYTISIDNKTLHIGDSRYQDYTQHKNSDRKNRYIIRHKKRENWTKSGIKTRGFWSRWLLWNKKSIRSSINDIKKRFNVSIKLKR